MKISLSIICHDHDLVTLNTDKKINRTKKVAFIQKSTNACTKDGRKIIITPSYSTEENQIETGEPEISFNENADSPKKQQTNGSVDCNKPSISPKPSSSNEKFQEASTENIKNDKIRVTTNNISTISSLEYRAIVGYMGTIEMPRQITNSNKLQTVKSCIKKLQREKRSPTTVLMTILPNCLTLKNSNSVTLASYPSNRLTYVTSSSETENRFFGLVTSTIYAHNEIEEEGAVGGFIQPKEISISNSCHVFVIDTKICDHSVHERRAIDFQITCTKDPISNLCLEFPSNSEYVVNLIRSMYTMKNVPFFSTNHNSGQQQVVSSGYGKYINQEPPANSPQPSNHSEITTTSSNSDSGIGFHNDCANIADRILVVDFPNIILNNRTIPVLSRPNRIFNNIGSSINGNNNMQISPEKIQLPITFPNELQQKINEFSKRANLRSDQKVLLAASVLSEALANASISLMNKNKSKLKTTKSYDDVLSTLERDEPVTYEKKKQIQMSMDDLSVLSKQTKSKVHFQNQTTETPSPQKKSPNKEHVFLAPPCKPLRKIRKTLCSSELKDENKPKCVKEDKNEKKCEDKKTDKKLLINFINLRRKSINSSNGKNSHDSFDIWGSLQDIKSAVEQNKYERHFVDGTYSEPDLLMSRALPSSNNSPFRRWGQSSFRATRTTPENRPIIARRPSSLAASENDVYTKSMDEFITDDIKSVYSHSDGGELQIGRAKALAQNFLNAISAQQNQANSSLSQNSLTNRVEIWGQSFEKLLEDPAGLQTFSEFLKKEFSAENIYFWTACERYRHITDDIERAKKAEEIYSKHLCRGACEQVNVDSQARNMVETNLQSADKNIFMYAQKQIYNLMKFDSYQRFIRSDLYKKCQEAETKNQPLPYNGENLSDLLKTSSMLHNSPNSSKLKKSASNAEDRRRKSLLPWHRRVRSKSKERQINNNNENGITDNNSDINPLCKSQSIGNTLKLTLTNSTSDIHSSRSSLSSFDANTCITSNNNSNNAALNNGSDDGKKNLCRVIFSDGATTVTLTRPDQTVRQLAERLLDKRGFKYQFFDVILSSNNKTLDLESSSNILIGKEVQIEQRIAFKLDLPDPKVISVKSKPKKALCDVLKPILQKYSYRFDEVQILMRDTHELIDLSQQVTAVDGMRLEVVLMRNSGDSNSWKPEQLQKRNGMTKDIAMLLSKESSIATELSYPQSHFHHHHPQSSINNKKNNLLNIQKNVSPDQTQINHKQSTLDEITNKVFSEVLQGKVESQGNNLPKSVDLCSLRSEDCTSESSSNFNQRIKSRDINSLAGKNIFKPKKISTNTFSNNQANSEVSKSNENLDDNFSNHNAQLTLSSNNNLKKPLIAKWKSGVKLQVTTRANNQEELLEGLKRAQRARLEDQRGTEINIELPDFLKDKAQNLSAANKLRKLRENLNPISGVNNSDQIQNRPQPAPRLSITKSASSMALLSNRSYTPTKTNTNTMSSSVICESKQFDENIQQNNNNNLNDENKNLKDISRNFDSNENDTNRVINNENNDNLIVTHTGTLKGPPPLPPKPKILPIKPSNWGQSSNNISNQLQLSPTTKEQIVNLIPIRARNLNNDVLAANNAYLDQPSSSFV